MVYTPVLISPGIFQGSENAPLDVIGVFNDTISWLSSSNISTVRRLESDCPTPLINTISPVTNSVSSICNVKPRFNGTDTLISILLVSRRLCAVIFQLPSEPSDGMPMFSVEKLPETSEKVSVSLTTFPEGS